MLCWGLCHRRTRLGPRLRFGRCARCFLGLVTLVFGLGGGRGEVLEMERVLHYVAAVDCYLDCLVWVGEEEDLLVEGEVVVVVAAGVGVGVKGLGEG